MSLDVRIDFDVEKNNLVVELIGEVDIHNSPKFKQKLLEYLEGKKVDVLIDGEKLDYIDSTGLGVLISVLKKVKATENNVIIMNLKPSIKKLFDITGLDKVFIIKE